MIAGYQRVRSSGLVKAIVAFFDDGNAKTDEPRPLPDGVSWSDLEQIQGAYEAGWHLRDIALLVHMDGRKYKKFQAACEYLGIDPKEKAL